jgi:3-(3-hydroxy-phenyl)propionate hydroxylase
MVPKSKGAEMLRNAVLDLARTMPFARRMVNSGRLHMPERYASLLTTADDEAFAGSAALGLPAPDAEMQDADGAKVWLLNALSPGFNLLAMAGGALKRELATKLPAGVALTVVGEDLIDAHGYFEARYDATPGACYLIRPDHYLCARWRQFDADKLAGALARAKGDL